MNTLKNTILSTKEAKAKLDHTVKQIFSNRQILARICLVYTSRCV